MTTTKNISCVLNFFFLFISCVQLNQTIEAVKEELAKEKSLSDKSQKELETDLVSTKHRSPTFIFVLVCFNESHLV